MTTLNVPTPSLKLEPPGPGLAVLEKPVTIAAPPVKLPDGTTLTDQLIGLVSGFLIYRQTPSSSGPQVWDAVQKTWRPGTDAVSIALQPKPLAFKSTVWEGIFVATAEKGAVEAGPNTYYFRTLFRVPYNGSTLAAISLPTPQVRFVSAADTMQAGIRIVDAPETATELIVYLRNSGKQEIGSVRLVNAGGTARIDVANSSGARVRIASNGDIELHPAPGRDVIVQGHLITSTLTVEHP